ncbi:unnamed protein product [Vitrella brassicaformis CCMP3155]|uniref:RCK N-terminal domain-containing protein n=6 Tax=Vitrella brassicaformis TaxID=1169539 RepID=A0A0G4EQY1_VITBC|nr:unnamed protein product [Vitrella brassicaformis CCMP3155]|eukprot:CEL99665.1 unnamed protein product [Vitrella brassicaformis CCMP3155]
MHPSERSLQRRATFVAPSTLASRTSGMLDLRLQNSLISQVSQVFRRCRVLVNKLFIQNPRVANMFDATNSALSFVECLIYVAESYEKDALARADEFFATHLAFSFFFLFDYLLRLVASPNKLAYIRTWSSLLDAVTILPVFVQWALRETVKLEVRVLDFFSLLRILRILRLYRLVAHWESLLYRQIAVVSLTIFSLLFITAGWMELVEDLDNKPEKECLEETMLQYDDLPLRYRERICHLDVHDWIYFVIVTISTLGYGDIAPQTITGRMTVVVLLSVTIVLLPQQTSQLAELLDVQAKYRNDYFRMPSKKTVPHIVLVGHLQGESLQEFLRELYHEDHGVQNQNRPLVMIQHDLPTQMQEALLRNPKYTAKLTYLQGSPTNPKDCNRAAVSSAAVAVFMVDRKASDPLVEDARTIMSALSIKKVAQAKDAKTSMRCGLQVVKAESKIFYRLCADRDKDIKRQRMSRRFSSKNDQVVCIEEILVNIMAKSCLCPGFVTLVHNLVVAAGSLSAKQMSDTNLFPNDGWMRSYLEGVSYEMYRTAISATFSGWAFEDVANFIFHEFHAILIGLEFSTSEGPIIVLNPTSYKLRGHHHTGSGRSSGIYGYVICGSKTSADDIATYEFRRGSRSPIKRLFTRTSFRMSAEASPEAANLPGAVHSRRSAFPPADRHDHDDDSHSIASAVSSKASFLAESSAAPSDSDRHTIASVGGGGLQRRQTMKVIRESIVSVWKRVSSVRLLNFRRPNLTTTQSRRLSRRDSPVSPTSPAHEEETGTLTDTALVRRPSILRPPGIQRRRSQVTIVDRDRFSEGSSADDIQPPMAERKKEEAPRSPSPSRRAYYGTLTQGQPVDALETYFDADDVGSSDDGRMKRAAKDKRTTGQKSRADKDLAKQAKKVPRKLIYESLALPGTDCYVRQHVLVCGMSTGLISFINCLRATYLPAHQPIVILNPTVPDNFRRLLRRIPDVFIVQGQASHFYDLLRANAFEADKAVILPQLKKRAHGQKASEELAAAGACDDIHGPESQGDSELVHDSEALLIFQMIRSINPYVHVIMEIEKASHLRLLETERVPEKLEQSYRDHNYTNSPFFAAGHISLPSIVDTILAQGVYNTHLMNIIDALLVARTQDEKVKAIMERKGLKSSNLFQISMPPDWIGDYGLDDDPSKTFGALLTYMLKQMTPKLTPLGIYRAAGTSDNILPFVITNPPKDFGLKNTDRIFCLGSQLPAYEHESIRRVAAAAVRPPVQPSATADCGPCSNAINQDDWNTLTSELQQLSSALRGIKSAEGLRDDELRRFVEQAMEDEFAVLRS